MHPKAAVEPTADPAAVTYGVATTLHIDGRWAAAASGRTFPATSPATGAVIGAVSEGSRADAARAIAAEIGRASCRERV